jgi:NodT family efflux transporter outer membrane factor (OMF) lipoprotein
MRAGVDHRMATGDGGDTCMTWRRPLAPNLCRHRGVRRKAAGGRARVHPVAAGVLLATVLSLCTSACMVGPDYVIPSAPVPAEFKELDGWKIATPGDEMDRGDWWAIYGDDNLSALLHEVDVSNQNIAAAEAGFRQSVALVQQARSGLFPSLGFSYAASRWHQGADALAAQGFQGFPPVTLSTFTMEPELAWTADVWGKLRRRIESDVALAQASAADLANARLSARTQLAVAYFNLRAADSLQQLLADTVAQYRKTYEITQDRYRVGTASDYDVETAGTQLDTAIAQEISVGVQRARLEHAIAVLIGRPPADVSIPRAPLARSIPVVPASLPSALLERRPDIAAAERIISSRNALVGVAVAAYFPDISLSGGFGSATFPFATFGYAGTSAFPIAVANEVWAVGGNLAEVIFDAGLRREQVAAALAFYYQSVAQYRQTVLIALQEVETQLSDLRIMAQQARAIERAVARARKALKITIDKYEIGTVDYTAVVQAQEVLLSNEISALTVRQDRFLASVRLIQALGGGWDATWLPTVDLIRHWRTCVSVRDTLRGPLDPEMPPCL